MAEGVAPSDGHGFFPSNLGQDNNAQEIQPREAPRDAHGREEHMLALGRPSSSSTKSLGKAIQADDEELDGAASSTKLIAKANADSMKHTDMDDPLNSTPVPKKNQPPKILSYLNDTGDHPPSRDEGREHDPRAFNCGNDDSTYTGESSTTRSTGVVLDGIPSPCAAELAKRTAAVSSLMKSVIAVDPSTEENVNSPLGGPSSSTPSLTKAVQDARGSEEHTLAVGRPPSSWTKSLGKAIETNDQEHDEAASSTKVIPKANMQMLVLQFELLLRTMMESLLRLEVLLIQMLEVLLQMLLLQFQLLPSMMSMLQLLQLVMAVVVAAAQPNVARQVPAPAQINGGGIAARPAPAQPNAGGPAPNAALPVPVLPPNPGLNNIDEALTDSGIRPLRNPADGVEGNIWDKLN